MADPIEDWVTKINSGVRSEEEGENVDDRCIYRVPVWLKEPVSDGDDQTPYEPEIISFGPYHWGEERFSEMEEHKRRCLIKMLRRKRQTVDLYITEMKTLEHKVRACYEKPLKMDKHKGRCSQETMLQRKEPDVNDDKKKSKVEDDFVKMLVVDGCFMLEFLKVNRLGLIALGYSHNDPVFSKRSIMQVIARDMIKLENQLPLIVLKTLLEIQRTDVNNPDRHFNNETMELEIVKLVLTRLAPTTWVNNETLNEDQLMAMRVAILSNTGNKKLHCLDIFRSSLLYQPVQPESSPESRIPEGFPNLTNDELEAAGPPIGDGLSTLASASASAAASTSASASTPASRPAENSPVNQTGNSASATEQDGPIPGGVCSWLPPCFIIGKTSTAPDIEDGSSTLASRPSTTCFSQLISNIMNCIRCPQLSYEKIRTESEQMVYCVEDLRDAGVKFEARTGQTPYVFWDLEFKKGRLKIPRIKIDDATKTLFLNLIAYEQLHLRNFEEMKITDYVAFMDNLVNSAADVRRLHQAGIIVHRLGSDAEVADMFNRLVKKVVIDRNAGNLSNIYMELNLYCTHKRHWWSASWRNEYMKNPWVIISIIAAFFLFGATILQTVYTVFPYYKPRKS